MNKLQLIESLKRKWLIVKSIRIEPLVNKPGNEMWRVGGGFHEYRKYFRIDLGSKGWRWTRDFDWYGDYIENIYPHCSYDHQRELDLYMEELIDEGVKWPMTHLHDSVVRCGKTIRERRDLYQKLWAKGKSFHRIVYIA